MLHTHKKSSSMISNQWHSIPGAQQHHAWSMQGMIHFLFLHFHCKIIAGESKSKQLLFLRGSGAVDGGYFDSLLSTANAILRILCLWNIYVIYEMEPICTRKSKHESISSLLLSYALSSTVKYSFTRDGMEQCEEKAESGEDGTHQINNNPNFQ